MTSKRMGMTSKSSRGHQYDVDAIIDVIGYCKFNVIPYFFVLYIMVVVTCNIMVVTYSAWIPVNYTALVCGTRGKREEGEEGTGGRIPNSVMIPLVQNSR